MKQVPDSRCVAISYNRLLLNDTSLWKHTSTAWGLVITMYVIVNKELKRFITSCLSVHDIEQLGRHYCKLSLQSVKTQSVADVYCMTVSSLLNPEDLQVFTKKQCLHILTAVFVFIRQSGRCLWPSIFQKTVRNKKKIETTKATKRNLISDDFEQLSVKLVISVDSKSARLFESWKLVLRGRNRRNNNNNNHS